eukprot:TRINITY_DN53310_c0_g2_i1.p1 TRINITY_DN53310_c0_g2~~TRINITY_DN53310_c0_g2_i1.p1  ORF type:complete len:164 (-),score=30.44 TRINITY_DN53310_c0_g2_i1:29-520(-)
MCFFFMRRLPLISTLSSSSAASDVYKRQPESFSHLKEENLAELTNHPNSELLNHCYTHLSNGIFNVRTTDLNTCNCISQPINNTIITHELPMTCQRQPDAQDIISSLSISRPAICDCPNASRKTNYYTEHNDHIAIYLTNAVSYTHLTLPTKRIASISVVAVS